MLLKTVGLGLALLLGCGVEEAGAGDGAVALRTADPSCPDDSGDIYVDCGNGTVTDNRTGLVWLANTLCRGDIMPWNEAMEFVAGLSDKPTTSAAAAHDCGLSDGSSPGEWRLPSIEELEAMVADALGQDGDPDCTASPPTITNDRGKGCWITGGPSSFSFLQSAHYWSSSSDVVFPTRAWRMDLFDASVLRAKKKTTLAVAWPVRGGQ